MKIYWWQGGVHLEPETDEEREALFILTTQLGCIYPRPDPFIGTHIGQGANEEIIGAVHEAP